MVHHDRIFPSIHRRRLVFPTRRSSRSLPIRILLRCSPPPPWVRRLRRGVPVVGWCHVVGQKSTFQVDHQAPLTRGGGEGGKGCSCLCLSLERSAAKGLDSFFPYYTGRRRMRSIDVNRVRTSIMILPIPRARGSTRSFLLCVIRRSMWVSRTMRSLGRRDRS